MGIFLDLEEMKNRKIEAEPINEQRVYTGNGFCIEIDPS